MAVKKMDKFPSLIQAIVTQSAANALTYSEINIGLNIFDKCGLLLSRIEYEISKSMLAEMTASQDSALMGLSSGQPSDPTLSSAEVIHSETLTRIDAGAAANANFLKTILVTDLSTLPGGGLLIAPKPLYAFAYTEGLASAHTFRVRVFFTIYTLTDAEYLELLETRRSFQ